MQHLVPQQLKAMESIGPDKLCGLEQLSRRVSGESGSVGDTTWTFVVGVSILWLGLACRSELLGTHKAEPNNPPTSKPT